MNNEYLERAKAVMTKDAEEQGAFFDAKALIILASKRAKQLAGGAGPMIRCKEDNYLDVALLEIAEGKLKATFGPAPEEPSVTQEFEEARKAARAANGEKTVIQDL